MKNLEMPTMTNVMGAEKELVKLAHKLLVNGALIEESKENRTMRMKIVGDYTISVSVLMPKDVLNTMRYGLDQFSASVKDSNDVRLQYHSSIQQPTVTALGKLIESAKEMHEASQSSDAYDKFDEYMRA